MTLTVGSWFLIYITYYRHHHRFVSKYQTHLFRLLYLTQFLLPSFFFVMNFFSRTARKDTSSSSCLSRKKTAHQKKTKSDKRNKFTCIWLRFIPHYYSTSAFSRWVDCLARCSHTTFVAHTNTLHYCIWYLSSNEWCFLFTCFVNVWITGRNYFYIKGLCAPALAHYT